ncbi:MAG: FAD-dependent oxidoreductase, partial [Akkermansiaceae bacterium]|nr:FAD-dependent oxidoreductase [Akkermansiaceae bacterium]
GPFAVRPRLDCDLARWGWLFGRHCTARHVAATSGLLLALNLESRRMFAELAEEEDFGLVQRGLLMLCTSAKGLDAEAAVAEAAHRLGLRAEVLDSAGAAKLDPDIRMSVAGAVHFPDDCHLDPARFMAAMRRRVLAKGGVIESGIGIERIETKAGRVVAVSGGGRRFEGGQFVVAAGAWSAGLLAGVGLKLPLQAGKGYSLTLPNPPELPQLCSILTEAKVAVTPVGSSLRFAGTMEVGGLDLAVNRARVAGIMDAAGRYFPGFSPNDFAGLEPWVGLRPVSADGLPYLGRVRSLANLIVNTGHAMMGLSLAPVSGKLAADLLAGRDPFRDIAALDPERF